jgi:hypothetical protein
MNKLPPMPARRKQADAILPPATVKRQSIIDALAEARAALDRLEALLAGEPKASPEPRREPPADDYGGDFGIDDPGDQGHG